MTPLNFCNRMDGEEIRRWRSVNRIKQEALASMLGVSHVAVSKWENGHARPSKILALRLSQVMSGFHEGRLAAEIAVIAPQHHVKWLTRGKSHTLIGVSKGYRLLWPDMPDLLGRDMRPLMINEPEEYCERSGLLHDAASGELLMMTGVSHRHLHFGEAPQDDFRFRWHTIIRRIDGELIHETILENCDPGTPVGFEHVLRRSDIQAAHE